jgi:hypothetical protein
MSNRASLSPILSLLAAAVVSSSGAAHGADRDQRLFDSVRGQWTGPGEVVAGKYKGTKFTCNFTGDVPAGKVGMLLDGSCRVGIFTQKMSASVERRGQAYQGTFLDGAEGKGLDIVSGNVEGRKAVFGLNRNQLKGAMLARLPDDDTMNVTVSVRVEDELVPVIGMSLKRVDVESDGAVEKASTVAQQERLSTQR